MCHNFYLKYYLSHSLGIFWNKFDESALSKILLTYTTYRGILFLCGFWQNLVYSRMIWPEFLFTFQWNRGMLISLTAAICQIESLVNPFLQIFKKFLFSHKFAKMGRIFLKFRTIKKPFVEKKNFAVTMKVV